jgi:hypothetical protein
MNNIQEQVEKLDVNNFPDWINSASILEPVWENGLYRTQNLMVSNLTYQLREILKP